MLHVSLGLLCVFLPGARVSCSDGVRNGNEEGVDCGGPQCEPCLPSALGFGSVQQYAVVGGGFAAVVACSCLVATKMRARRRRRSQPSIGQASTSQVQPAKTGIQQPSLARPGSKDPPGARRNASDAKEAAVQDSRGRWNSEQAPVVVAWNPSAVVPIEPPAAKRVPGKAHADVVTGNGKSKKSRHHPPSSDVTSPLPAGRQPQGSHCHGPVSGTDTATASGSAEDNGCGGDFIAHGLNITRRSNIMVAAVSPAARKPSASGLPGTTSESLAHAPAATSSLLDGVRSSEWDTGSPRLAVKCAVGVSSRARRSRAKPKDEFG